MQEDMCKSKMTSFNSAINMLPADESLDVTTPEDIISHRESWSHFSSISSPIQECPPPQTESWSHVSSISSPIQESPSPQTESWSHASSKSSPIQESPPPQTESWSHVSSISSPIQESPSPQTESWSHASSKSSPIQESQPPQTDSWSHASSISSPIQESPPTLTTEIIYPKLSLVTDFPPPQLNTARLSHLGLTHQIPIPIDKWCSKNKHSPSLLQVTEPFPNLTPNSTPKECASKRSPTKGVKRGAKPGKRPRKIPAGENKINNISVLDNHLLEKVCFYDKLLQ